MIAAALCGVAKPFAPGQDRPPRTIGRQNAAVPHFDLAILRAPAGSPTVAGPSLDVGGSSIQHVPVVAGQNNKSATLARCSQYGCQLAQNLHGPNEFDLVRTYKLRIYRIVDDANNFLIRIGQGGSNALIQLRSGTNVGFVE